MLADNAKHNQHGRVDELGAIRHRHVELCAISALALHFFSYFHVLDNPLPSLQPDFNNRDYGEYGHRPWYSSHVFPGKTLDSEMSYESRFFSIMMMALVLTPACVQIIARASAPSTNMQTSSSPK